MKKIRLLAVGLCLLFVLTACGENAKKSINNSETTPTGSVSVTPTGGTETTPAPTEAPEPVPQVPAEAYRQVRMENLYQMDIERYLGPGYSFYDGEVRDGFVLLYLYKEGTEDMNRRFALFPVLNPSALVIGEVEGSVDSYPSCFLSNDGNVLVLYENEHRAILNPQLGDKAKSWNYVAGSFAGCSDDGYCWITENGGILKGYSFSEDRLVTYRYENAGKETFFCNFCGQQDDRLYFFTMIPNSRLFVLDRTTERLERMPLLQPDATYLKNAALTYASSNILISNYSDPEGIRLFPRTNPSEEVVFYQDRILTTSRMEYGTDGEYFARTYFNLYDLQNGGVAGRISSEDFAPEFGEIEAFGITEEGYLILHAWGDTDGANQLFLYDALAGTSEPGDRLKVYQRGEGFASAQNFVEHIEERFPTVHVFFDEVGLDTYNSSYRLIPCSDEEKLCDFLIRLEQCLSRYPEGMIEELGGTSKEGLNIFLCDGFVRTDQQSITNPMACVNKTGNYFDLCIGVKWIDSLEYTLIHEMMHLFEYRIEEFGMENGLSPMLYWKKALNSKEYPLIESYLDENGNEFSDYSGTAFRDPKTAWFIDAYARTCAAEDMARTLEYMAMEGFGSYFVGPHLQAKGKFLCAIIREAFPSIRASEELMPWERIFGKVSFAEYYELMK